MCLNIIEKKKNSLIAEYSSDNYMIKIAYFFRSLATAYAAWTLCRVNVTVKQEVLKETPAALVLSGVDTWRLASSSSESVVEKQSQIFTLKDSQLLPHQFIAQDL